MIDSKRLVDEVFNFIIKHFGNSLRKRMYLLKSMCRVEEKYGDDFISYNCRPKSGDNYIINKEVGEDLNEKCAIVIQGPILIENDFTIETAKLYKNMYPKQSIIVSTWKDADLNSIKKLKDLNVEVVLNDPPKTTGLGNINYQILSTMGGINRAKELNCEYILKTRTDQRIGMPGFLNYFLCLLDLYPISNNKCTAKKRLVVTPGIVGGIMFIPYMLSDFLYFGTIEDVSRLFNMELDPLNMTRSERDIWTSKLITNSTVYNYYKKTAPELRIIKNYIENYTDIDPDGSVKSYWKFVKEYAITLGMQDIDLYWRKYDIYEESEVTKIYPRDDSKDKNYRYIWNFANWLMLYSGKIKYNTKFETYKNKLIIEQ